MVYNIFFSKISFRLTFKSEFFKPPFITHTTRTTKWSGQIFAILHRILIVTGVIFAFIYIDTICEISDDVFPRVAIPTGTLEWAFEVRTDLSRFALIVNENFWRSFKNSDIIIEVLKFQSINYCCNSTTRGNSHWGRSWLLLRPLTHWTRQLFVGKYPAG